jgi:adenylate cyclase
VRGKDGRDIYGDGVNVAARLEALAEPGGICVSRMVRDQVRDKLAFSFEDMGEQQVKNIARPIRVHRILLGEKTNRSETATGGRQQNPPLALPDKPSERHGGRHAPGSATLRSAPPLSTTR